MYQINKHNLANTWIIVSKDNKVKLKEILKLDWKKAF
jgi:hypothetical protein